MKALAPFLPPVWALFTMWRTVALRRSLPPRLDELRPVGASRPRAGRLARLGALADRHLTRLGRAGITALAVAVGPDARRVAAVRALAPVAVGRAVAGAAVALLVAPPLVGPLPTAAAVVAGAVATAGRRRRRARARTAAVVGALPELVDLLRLAVDAGCTVPAAVRAVAPLAPPPFDRALDDVLARTARGQRLADALDALPGELGEPVRPLAAALAGCERYGTPVAPTLERLAADVRRDRRRRAEEVARTLPVRLLFPLVLCTLPALVLLTVAPVVSGALRSLRL